MVEGGRIENVYRLQLMNATEAHAARPRSRSKDLPGATLASWSDVDLAATEARWVPVAVQIGPEQASSLRPGRSPDRSSASACSPHADAARDRRADLHEKSTFIVPR